MRGQVSLPVLLIGGLIAIAIIMFRVVRYGWWWAQDNPALTVVVVLVATAVVTGMVMLIKATHTKPTEWWERSNRL